MGISIATCVTCGDELHPERAEKYDYCTKPGCRQANARPLPIAAVGVNKASDQFVVLDERTREEAASGRYKKVPEARGPARPRHAQNRPARSSEPVRDVVPRSSITPSKPRWSQAQENLALTYRAMGMAPEAIAKKLGITPYLVTQILLSAPSRSSR